MSEKNVFYFQYFMLITYKFDYKKMGWCLRHKNKQDVVILQKINKGYLWNFPSRCFAALVRTCLKYVVGIKFRIRKYLQILMKLMS